MTETSEVSPDQTRATLLAARHCAELVELCQQPNINDSMQVATTYFMTLQKLLTESANADNSTDTTS